MTTVHIGPRGGFFIVVVTSFSNCCGIVDLCIHYRLHSAEVDVESPHKPDTYRIYYVDMEVMRFILHGKVWPRLNFPKEDKPHNLRVDVVDPASTTDKSS